MDKTYDPVAIEQTWYQHWEDKGYFKAQGGRHPYCIVIPPPNVTGSLHMGHAFQDTIMDTLIRYHRMKGDNTLWQPGTDHAGIATQMVVERQLVAENKTRLDLGRSILVFEDDSFIPHDAQESEEFMSPILIHNEPALRDERQLLINLADAIPTYFAQFDRVIELVTENNKQQAREHYNYYRERGYPLTHHKL